MTSQDPPRNDAAMADILASIRRIVAEEDARIAETAPAPPGPQGDILELTPAMRADSPDPAASPRNAPAPPPGAAARQPARAAAPVDPGAPPDLGPDPADLGPDPDDLEPDMAETRATVDLAILSPEEARIAEIAAAVLQNELDGPPGNPLNARIREIVREELARAIEEIAAEG